MIERPGLTALRRVLVERRGKPSGRILRRSVFPVIAALTLGFAGEVTPGFAQSCPAGCTQSENGSFGSGYVGTQAADEDFTILCVDGDNGQTCSLGGQGVPINYGGLVANFGGYRTVVLGDIESGVRLNATSHGLLIGGKKTDGDPHVDLCMTHWPKKGTGKPLNKVLGNRSCARVTSDGEEGGKCGAFDFHSVSELDCDAVLNEAVPFFNGLAGKSLKFYLRGKISDASKEGQFFVGLCTNQKVECLSTLPSPYDGTGQAGFPFFLGDTPNWLGTNVTVCATFPAC